METTSVLEYGDYQAVGSFAHMVGFVIGLLIMLVWHGSLIKVETGE